MKVSTGFVEETYGDSAIDELASLVGADGYDDDTFEFDATDNGLTARHGSFSFALNSAYVDAIRAGTDYDGDIFWVPL